MSASTSTSTSALPTCRQSLRQLPCAVGTAGPQLQGFGLANSSPISSPTSARSGHRWASTAGFRSEWARLDLNRKGLSAVGTAGPQWAPLDLNGQIECQKINGQVECQKICQIECQKIRQIKCQKVCQIECQIECEKVCQIKCQNVCQIEARRFTR